MIDCQFEDGPQANLRHAVIDALVIRDGQILLTKRADHLRSGGRWAIPGGFIERDETTMEAVMREVLEETGHTCEVKQLVTVMDNPNRRGDDRQNISFVFEVSPITQVAEADPAEVSAVAWFPLDQLPDESEMAFDHLEIIWEWVKQHDSVLGETLDNNA